MSDTIKLRNPITINGKDYTHLNHDANEITITAFVEAEDRKMKAGGSYNRAGAAEVDYSMHIYLGFAAIIAVHPEIAWDDLERVKGDDIRSIMRIGRNFMLNASAEASQDDESESASETSPESFTPPSGISEEDG